MTDNLARRMADNQIRMTAAELQRDAERLAIDAQRYAEELKAGQTADAGMAYRLAQSAADILRQASRLDGMHTIGGLVGE
jgi:hypothetical protein